MIITQMMPIIGIIPTKWYSVSVQYPVCGEHAYLGRLKAFVVQRTPFNVVVLTFTSIWLVLNVLFYVSLLMNFGPGGDTDSIGYVAIAPLSLLLIYFWARRSVPVRIETVDERTALLVFRNENYAAFFQQANKSIYFED